MNDLVKNMDYKDWLVELKSTIQQRQIKAAIAVNSELILLYWELGKQIVEKQENAKWGTGFIDQLSLDLKAEFPQMNGFSRSNLFAIKKFYSFYNQHSETIHQIDGQNKTNTIIHQTDGQFENQEKKMILIVVEVTKLQRLRQIVRQSDPDAFLIITEASEMLGRGN